MIVVEWVLYVLLVVGSSGYFVFVKLCFDGCDWVIIVGSGL